MARWNDTTVYPNLASPAADDLLPIADVSADAGERQRHITWAQLVSAATGLVNVNSYSADRTLDAEDDLGSHARFTAAATVTIPPGLPLGWSCGIGNATASDTVALAEGSGVTLLSAGVEVSNGKYVSLLVVASNVVEAVGAFADE